MFDPVPNITNRDQTLVVGTREPLGLLIGVSDVLGTLAVETPCIVDHLDHMHYLSSLST